MIYYRQVAMQYTSGHDHIVVESMCDILIIN
jgi:hypothetical protein